MQYRRYQRSEFMSSLHFYRRAPTCTLREIRGVDIGNLATCGRKRGVIPCKPAEAARKHVTNRQSYAQPDPCNRDVIRGNIGVKWQFTLRNFPGFA